MNVHAQRFYLKRNGWYRKDYGDTETWFKADHEKRVYQSGVSLKSALKQQNKMDAESGEAFDWSGYARLLGESWYANS